MAYLKHCLPKGMPTMVMHSMQPMSTASTQRGRPLTQSHIILSISEPRPPPNRTSLPKGQNRSLANLKHCTPQGMPIMVMHQSSPASTQPRPSQSPANINHNALPTKRICVTVLSYISYAISYHYCAVYSMAVLKTNFDKILDSRLSWCYNAKNR